MLGIGWLTLWQAQEALDSGRLEEAQKLLARPEAVGHLGSSTMLQQLARRLVERGNERWKHQDMSAAWKDLVQAENIGGVTSEAAGLRQRLADASLAEAKRLLQAGEARKALDALAAAQAGVKVADYHFIEEACRQWLGARDLAQKGEFAQAIKKADRAGELLNQRPPALEHFRGELVELRPKCQALLVQLHDGWAARRWPEVLRAAEQVLAIAPQHPLAQKARSRAYNALESPAQSPARAMEKEQSERFVLWVDGAGGYLVCLDSRVKIGQAAPDAFVDIPLLADLSRHHATLTRDSEGYLFEAARSAAVNGRPTERALLQADDRITLGTSCQLQFRQPVPVSATARLDLVSGHRLPLSVDGVILMAETLVLGDGPQAHVVIPDMARSVVLFRQKEGLGVRAPGEWMLDGRPVRDRGTLGRASTVRGEDFSFAVEPIGAGTGRL
jgi:tetratricopeptide (TPR) repeat protein